MSSGYDPKKAVALKYNQDKQQAPTISAKGKGFVADEILARAKNAGVPIQEDRSLVEILGELEVNQKIPEELYQAVAEVFAYIYRLDRKKSE